jgi:hypothetical protein
MTCAPRIARASSRVIGSIGPLFRDLIVRRDLIGVYCGSLRVRQAGGGENLLDPCVLAAAVLVDVRGGGTGPPLGGGVLLSQA